MAEALLNQQLSFDIVGAAGFFNHRAFDLKRREPISMAGVGGLAARIAVAALHFCISRPAGIISLAARVTT